MVKMMLARRICLPPSRYQKAVPREWKGQVPVDTTGADGRLYLRTGIR